MLLHPPPRRRALGVAGRQLPTSPINLCIPPFCGIRRVSLTLGSKYAAAQGEWYFVDLSAVPRKYRQRVTANGTAVNVTKHGWTDLPEWLSTLTELRILNLRNNKLRRLPEWLGTYTHLPRTVS